MKGTALLYRPGSLDLGARADEQMPVPEETALAVSPPLEFLQKAVGGSIEAVPGFDSIERDGVVVRCVAFCKEGKRHGLAVNMPATLLWDQALRRLVGDNGKRLYSNGLLRPDGTLADVLCGSVGVLVGDDQLMESVGWFSHFWVNKTWGAEMRWQLANMTPRRNQ